ncbi:hypothetical protein [Actinoplanes rectilineatus]|uniref:hypothetical protein n=1 Tax=Actinoplanes rectilineatus TaxID=113571 RepID=UPI0005F28CC9|nr:hypothetical protein [Actinoplanes rectilineatus]
MPAPRRCGCRRPSPAPGLAGPAAAAERDAVDATYEALNNPLARRPYTITAPDGTSIVVDTPERQKALKDEYAARLRTAHRTATAAAKERKRAEQRAILDMLGEIRPYGGKKHPNPVPVGPPPTPTDYGETRIRPDWRERLDRGFRYFPDAWVEAGNNRPLRIGTSRRAFYTTADDGGGTLGLQSPPGDRKKYDGAFDDHSDEVTVHELGHRMEQTIPGLKALEFALVRRYGRDGGRVEKLRPLGAGYGKDEVTQPDEWFNPYTGKSYELAARSGRDRGPHETNWEIFQVGLQDTFGRRNKHGRPDDPDLLPAFVVGALATLG